MIVFFSPILPLKLNFEINNSLKGKKKKMERIIFTAYRKKHYNKYRTWCNIPVAVHVLTNDSTRKPAE